MELLLLLGAFSISFLMVILSVPAIINIARAKKLFEPFEQRKVHKQRVPPLGGVAIFIGFTLAIIILTNGSDFNFIKYLVAGIILMFFVGLKDDLLVISPRKKIIIQLWAALILIILGNIRITNFHGMVGIYEIPYWSSVLVSVFIIVVITNAFNLIDGVDGLAAGLAILAVTVMGFWFYVTANYQLSIICLALVGSLAGFFIYNVFGHSCKLFMGDSGSLTVGIILSSLIIKFNELNVASATAFHFDTAPVISFAFIIVPLVDTLRVMTIRLAQRRSPFLPDKNHIHHRLFSLFENHLKVTATLIATNAILIFLAVLFHKTGYNINIQFFSVFLLAAGLSFIPSILLKIKASTEKAEQKQIEKIIRFFTQSIAMETYYREKKRQEAIYILRSHHHARIKSKSHQQTLSPKGAKKHLALINEGT